MVKLLEAKYFYNSNPFEPTRNYELSWIWTSIQKDLNIIKRNYIWKVKNGASTKIWEDIWIPNTERLNIPREKEEPLPKKVQDLLNNEGSWDTGKLDEFFPMEIKEKILSITPNIQERDRIRWKQHESGDFTAKNMYNYLINQDAENEDNMVFSWKKIWKMQAIPRIRLFIWKLVQKALPTTSRLAGHNSEISPECPMRNNQAMETENYLFRTCPLARSIWFGCSLDAINYQINTDSMSKWVETWISDPKLAQFWGQIATIL